MPNTRTDLIQTLVDRKLYPKKKKPIGSILPDGSAFFKATIPTTKQPVKQPVTQPIQQLPVQPITKIELPTKPLAKLLFLKRTLGI